ncbi:MAG: hypothetical protein HQM08_11665 [Candidatus Riflebacteria bacterium]|nr:hypothetical protein [Candidatus Riflebacteria bacterium]
MNSILERKGMAIAIVLMFVFSTLIFAGAMFFFRKEVKRENLLMFNDLQSDFVAQAGIQHARMKIEIFSQELFESGSVQMGFCPFKALISGETPPGVTKKSIAGMEILREDCTCKDLPFSNFGEPEIDQMILRQWKYEVASLSALSLFTELNARQRTQVVSVVASGTTVDPKGNLGPKIEKLIRTIQLTRTY